MQLNPFQDGQEPICIHVHKVYDWIINEADFTLPLGNTTISFPGLPAGADLSGVTTTCEVLPDPTNPFQIVSREDRTVIIDGEEVTLQWVTIQKNVMITFMIMLADGTVFRSGNTEEQYLYVANSDDSTIEIYNISDPTAPVREGQFGGGDLDEPFGLAITGSILYVSNRDDSTVEIYDISNPTAPVREGQFGDGDLDQPVSLAITGSILYVSNINDNTIEIYDISDPIVPVREGQFGAVDLDEPSGLAITGSILYVSNNGDNTIEIYDISDPTAPVQEDQFGAVDLSGPTGLEITGSILYVSNLSDNTIEIYDISDPIVPVREDQFGTGDLSGPTGLEITGSILYVSNSSDGTIEIYDISDPTVPVRESQFGAGDLNIPVGLAITGVSGPQRFSLFEQVVLCAPTGTNIDITYTQRECFLVSTGTLTESPGGGQITFSNVIIKLTLCQSIQSTFPVAVELEADFCQPRDVLPQTCPSPVRPPQCPIVFPEFPPSSS